MLPPIVTNTFQVLFVYAAHVAGVLKVSAQQLGLRLEAEVSQLGRV